MFLGTPLKVGSYIHCMVKSDTQMERMIGESRSVNVTVEPRKIFRQQVCWGGLVFGG